MTVVEPPSRVPIMVVAAHPDDMESWCAGTLVRAIDSGATVRLLLVTSGEHGTSDPADVPELVATRREAEAQAAAQRLGLAEVAFLHYPDGDVEATRSLRGDLVMWIRRWQPHALFTHDPEHPWPPYLSHRDHRSVGRATLDAIYPLARDPLAFPEHASASLKPHAVREVWLFASEAANFYVDITHGLERKIAARLAHVSQTSEPAALPESWRARASVIGAPAGLACAEAFTIVAID